MLPYLPQNPGLRKLRMITLCQVCKQLSKVDAILEDVFAPPMSHYFPRVWAETHKDAPFSPTLGSIPHRFAPPVKFEVAIRTNEATALGQRGSCRRLT